MYLPLEYDTPPGHYSEKQMAQTQGIFSNHKGYFLEISRLFYNLLEQCSIFFHGTKRHVA